jgi:hypothetical protein
MLETIRKNLTENFFTFIYSLVAAATVILFVKTPEGKANLYETLALGFIREAMFLITVFTFIKMLQGVDKDLKEDLFSNAYTTTAFICVMVIGSAMMLAVR